jgi:hypothetical protein
MVRDAMHRGGGTLYSAGKFGYGVILGIAGLPAGVTENLALALSWLAGMLIIVIAARLAWIWSHGSFAAMIIAGLGIGMSPLCGLLSREASGNVWALALALAGLLIMTESEWKLQRTSPPDSQRYPWLSYALAGVLMGFAFTCHFNIAPFIAAIFSAQMSFCWNRRSARRWSHELSYLSLTAGAFAAFLGVVQTVTVVADYKLAAIYPKFMSFGEELLHLFTRDQAPMLHGVLLGDGMIGWGAPVWKYYGSVFLREGIMFVIGSGFGFLWMIASRQTRIIRRSKPSRPSGSVAAASRTDDSATMKN